MLIHSDQSPRHETPNGVMRTLAAPSLGASELSVWEVAMEAGKQGPAHSASREQVWTILTGRLVITVDGTVQTVDAGDTLIIAAASRRQVTADQQTRVIVASPAAPTVTTPGGDRRPLPWAV